MKRLLFLLLPIALLLTATSAHAQITAANCTQPAVQAAFNSVIAGTTTVTIPAGTCHWTTSASLSVPSGNTTLTISGAGSTTTIGGGDQTIIIDDYNSTACLLCINTNSTTTAKVRLSGITVQGGSSGAFAKTSVVSFGGSSQNIRVDHSHFNASTYVGGNVNGVLVFNGCVAGVTDSSIFDAKTGSVTNLIRLYNNGSCAGDALGVGDQSWTQDTNPGTASNYMYIENNILNNGAGNDCTSGSRYVWRFNTMNNSGPSPAVQTHPTGGAGRIRGCRAQEIYKNNATAVPANYINAFFWFSSGTALVWGNTLPSSSTGGGTGYKNVIQVHNMRNDNSSYGQTATPNGWGYCGTNFNGTGSNWDQNTSAATGYHCLDAPTRGKGDLLTGGFSSDGSGSNNVTNNATSCTSTSSCAYPRQASEPAYEWLDAYSPVPSNPSAIWAGNSTYFVENTDYYLGTLDNGSPITFNGSLACATAPHCGVGVGTRAARPATCTTGVAYWSTDQGSWNSSGSGGQGVLDKCTSTNTWTNAFYTPLAYPHPLINGGVGAPTVSFSPSPLAFGNQNTGTSTTLTQTVSNSGTANEVLAGSNAVAVSGNAAYSLVAGGTCVNSLTIAPGGSCTALIKFAPSTIGSLTGTLTITGTVNATNSLTGTGTNAISIPATPTGLSAVVAGSSINLSWTASTGTPTGYNVLRATVSGGPYATIATLGLTTTYSDTSLSAGTYYYVVNAFNTAGTSPNSSQVSGTIVAAVPSANLAPTSIAFGNVVIGTTASAPQVAILSSNGTATLASIVVGSPSLPDFSANTSCGSTLTVGSNCTINPSFTPTSAGLQTATLCVTSNDPNSPDCTTLTGTGVAATSVSPTSLSFGRTYVNKTSASQTVTFTNNSPFTVTISAAITGGDSTQFTKGTDTCNSTVAPAATCTVAVTSTPTSAGNKASNLVLTYTGASGSPISVPLTGTGTTHKVRKGVIL